MSTIAEAHAAATLGVRVAVVSLVTNLATGIAHGPLDHAEVIQAAHDAGARLGRLLRRTAALLAEGPPGI
jgi:purine-nucleoside phosphorylase